MDLNKPKPNISKVCEEILEICNSDEKKKMVYAISFSKYKTILREFPYFYKIEEQDLDCIINTQLEIFKIKDTKARYIELEIANILQRYPILIVNKVESESESPREEAILLQEKYTEDADLDVKLNSRFLKYCNTILNQKPERSKRYKNRVKDALAILSSLLLIYYIENIKEIFLSKINDKDEGVQYTALDGLANYYYCEESDISDEEIAQLEKIIETTKDRSIASTCCQIMINAGHIDEFTALNIMDDWKEQNWYS